MNADVNLQLKNWQLLLPNTHLLSFVQHTGTVMANMRGWRFGPRKELVMPARIILRGNATEIAAAAAVLCCAVWVAAILPEIKSILDINYGQTSTILHNNTRFA